MEAIGNHHIYKLPRKRILMKRLIGLNIAVALAAAFAVLGAAEKTEERTRLSGAGASFPSKIYT